MPPGSSSLLLQDNLFNFQGTKSTKPLDIRSFMPDDADSYDWQARCINKIFGDFRGLRVSTMEERVTLPGLLLMRLAPSSRLFCRFDQESTYSCMGLGRAGQATFHPSKARGIFETTGANNIFSEPKTRIAVSTMRVSN